MDIKIGRHSVLINSIFNSIYLLILARVSFLLMHNTKITHIHNIIYIKEGLKIGVIISIIYLLIYDVIYYSFLFHFIEVNANELVISSINSFRHKTRITINDIVDFKIIKIVRKNKFFHYFGPIIFLQINCTSVIYEFPMRIDSNEVISFYNVIKTSNVHVDFVNISNKYKYSDLDKIKTVSNATYAIVIIALLLIYICIPLLFK